MGVKGYDCHSVWVCGGVRIVNVILSDCAAFKLVPVSLTAEVGG